MLHFSYFGISQAAFVNRQEFFCIILLKKWMYTILVRPKLTCGTIILVPTDPDSMLQRRPMENYRDPGLRFLQLEQLLWDM